MKVIKKSIKTKLETPKKKAIKHHKNISKKGNIKRISLKHKNKEENKEISEHNPEIPFFDDIIPSSDNPKHDHSWFKSIFNSDKKEKKEKIKEEIIEDTKEAEKAKNLEPFKREKLYMENMKRVMDAEIRERHNHANIVDQHLNKKEKELIEKEEKLMKQEIRNVEYEKEYIQIKQLRDELENEKISNTYQKQRIAELKAELALKDAYLREKEIELDKREDKINEYSKLNAKNNEVSIQKDKLKTLVNEEDDAIIYLQEELKKQKEKFEKKMLAFKMESLKNPKILEDIEIKINQSYLELSQDNTKEAAKLYQEIKATYQKEGKQLDENKKVYKEILSLYKNISKHYK